jgi:hypothetical protein
MIYRPGSSEYNISQSSWKGLCQVGAYAILIVVIFFRRNYGAELMAFNGF